MYTVLEIQGNYGLTGGVGTMVAMNMRCLDRRMFRPVLVELQKPGQPSAVQIEGFEKHTIRWTGLLGARAGARELGRLVKELRADLVHTHDMRAHLAAFLMRRHTAVPWVAHEHGWLGFTHSLKGQLFEAIDKRIIRAADMVLVGSRATGREVERQGVKRLHLIPNAVVIPEENAYAEEAARIREHLGLTPERVLIGMFGRLHPGKGQVHLVQALHLLIQKGLPVRGLILGEGPERIRLERMIAELRVQDQVTLAGFVEHPHHYVRAMDICAVPSLKESLPLTALESMALGKAVVASTAGDLSLTIQAGENGMLVPPSAPVQLAEALEKLVHDAALRERMGHAARATILATRTAETQTRALEERYLELIQERKVACA